MHLQTFACVYRSLPAPQKKNRLEGQLEIDRHSREKQRSLLPFFSYTHRSRSCKSLCRPVWIGVSVYACMHACMCLGLCMYGLSMCMHPEKKRRDFEVADQPICRTPVSSWYFMMHLFSNLSLSLAGCFLFLSLCHLSFVPILSVLSGFLLCVFFLSSCVSWCVGSA